MLKRGISHILRFVRYADEGAIAPIAPSFGYATDYSTIEALNLVCIVLLCHKPKWQNKLDIQLCYMIRLRKSISARFLYNSNNRLPCKNWCILCDPIRSLRDPQFGKPWSRTPKKTQSESTRLSDFLIIAWLKFTILLHCCIMLFKKMPLLCFPKTFQHTHKIKIGKSLKRVDSDCFFLVF